MLDSCDDAVLELRSNSMRLAIESLLVMTGGVLDDGS